MTRDPGQWRVFGQRPVYDGGWVRLELVDVQTSGGARFEHHVVRLGRIAIALIVNERQEALMLWSHRFAIDRWGYELLGGLVEDGEQPAVTAAREARGRADGSRWASRNPWLRSSRYPAR